MNSEMQKNIDGYLEACARCNVSPERTRLIKAVLDEFKEYCDNKTKVEKEKARLYMASKL